MLMVQIDCVRNENETQLCKTVWIDKSWKVKPGDQVVFKGDDRKWDIVEVYGTELNADAIETKWGLELPKSQRTER